MYNSKNRPAPSINEQGLIAISNNNGKQLVDARELHRFLGSNRKFSDWIKKRISDYGFTENEDFTTFHKIVKRKKSQRGASARTEYAISLDMAKELSMVERNEKGRQARKYFIEAEKQLREYKKGIVLELPQVHIININGIDYLKLHSFLKQTKGYSNQQDYSRIAEHPQHYIAFNGKWYVSRAMSEMLLLERAYFKGKQVLKSGAVPNKSDVGVYSPAFISDAMQTIKKLEV